MREANILSQVSSIDNPENILDKYNIVKNENLKLKILLKESE